MDVEAEIEERAPASVELDDAIALKASDPRGATARLLALVQEDMGMDVRVREKAVVELGVAYAEHGMHDELMRILDTLKPFFDSIAKSKTAKLVRDLVDRVATVPDSLPLQITLCNTCIAWSRREKRTFLRQRLQARLAALLLQNGDYQASIALTSALSREVKKLDDKQLLVEIHLVEARTHHALRNLPKAKAALTAARTSANAIYVVPVQQAEIDELAGTLQADDREYRTAFSYFFEAFENYSTLGHPRAPSCLKYMCLAKIMTGKVSELA